MGPRQDSFVVLNVYYGQLLCGMFFERQCITQYSWEVINIYGRAQHELS
jgi:hypothetical protein